MTTNIENDYSVFPSLTQEEAKRRLLADGYNELPSSKPRSIWRIAVEVLKEPMFILLLVCGLIYFILGDHAEAALLLCSIFLIMAITFYQERKTERALEALKDLSSPRAMVIRDGQPMRIPGREVARGDLLILSEGDRVPADATILDTSSLSVNESLLTGESVPVRKKVWDGCMAAVHPGGDDLPFVYSGTLVTQGRAVAQVMCTGMNTEMGKIGKSLQLQEQGKTLLEKEVKVLVRNMALWGMFLCLAVVVAYGFMVGEWLPGILAGVALAMSMVPEEFPVILTVFLALGAWRMSRKQVLTRRVPVIETLGAATVLCVDKTGTLTENRMQVLQLYANERYFDVNGSKENILPEGFHSLVEFAVLASHRDPFDPMEQAIRSFGGDNLRQTEHWHNDWRLVKEYPLSTSLLAMSQVWESPGKQDFVIGAKGSPEAIMDLCHLPAHEVLENNKRLEKMAKNGLRVLGVARAKFNRADLPRDQHDLKFEFLGFVGLLDPVRPQAPEAIKECAMAGIRVIMITGDHPLTAERIAREAGLPQAQNIIVGTDLDSMSDEELQRQVKSVAVFARTVPEQKLRIVQALKANGEVVAMTGDGVNDAPALKAANVSIAMGQRGTDVAREVADLVLLDDNFTSIVGAVRQGRKVYDNLSKAMIYVLAFHVPIAGMVLLPILMGLPLMLLPVQIVFLELIIDPACSIVFEAESAESHIMRRKPRNLQRHLFNRNTLSISIVQGVIILIMTLLVYFLSLRVFSEELARTIAYVTLIAANISLILTNRTGKNLFSSLISSRNIPLRVMLVAVPAILALVIYCPPVARLFQFGQPTLWQIVVAIVVGVSSVLWHEIYKTIKNSRAEERPAVT